MPNRYRRTLSIIGTYISPIPMLVRFPPGSKLYSIFWLQSDRRSLNLKLREDRHRILWLCWLPLLPLPPYLCIVCRLVHESSNNARIGKPIKCYQKVLLRHFFSWYRHLHLKKKKKLLYSWQSACACIPERERERRTLDCVFSHQNSPFPAHWNFGTPGMFLSQPSNANL